MSQKETHTYCPYCKEAIKSDAIKCRYCGSMIESIDKLASISPTDSFTFIKNALKGKYEIGNLIGKGGMASVYRARQINLGRTVALKVIHPNLIHDQEFIDRFLQEARVCASLSHPNIINIYDFGEVGGIYYMGMELLEGSDLSVIMQQEKRLNPQRALYYLAPIANALIYIHQKGFMHRDVKSSNIFVTKDGRPVLMDFGIAYASGSKPLTVAGTILGTPQFLSPEQALGNKATPESDYYGLGIVLYECLTGRVPFHDPNPMIVINKIIKEVPVPPSRIFSDIPSYAEEITMNLLHKDPKKRITAINSVLGSPHEAKRVKKKPTLIKPPKEKTHYLKHESRTHHGSGLKGSKHLLKLALLGLLLLTLAGIFTGIYLQVSKNDSGTTVIAETEKIASEKLLYLPVIESITDEEAKPPPPVAPTSAANELLQIIESQMVDYSGTRMMKDFVNNRVWRLVMHDQTGENEFPVRRVSYNDIELFINRLNAIDGNPYQYELPSLNIVKQAVNSGFIGIPESEWVNDPPIFRQGLREDLAKYYHKEFNDEAAENRKRARNDIFFRLVRQN